MKLATLTALVVAGFVSFASQTAFAQSKDDPGSSPDNPFILVLEEDEIAEVTPEGPGDVFYCEIDPFDDHVDIHVGPHERGGPVYGIVSIAIGLEGTVWTIYNENDGGGRRRRDNGDPNPARCDQHHHRTQRRHPGN